MHACMHAHVHLDVALLLRGASSIHYIASVCLLQISHQATLAIVSRVWHPAK